MNRKILREAHQGAFHGKTAKAIPITTPAHNIFTLLDHDCTYDAHRDRASDCSCIKSSFTFCLLILLLMGGRSFLDHRRVFRISLGIILAFALCLCQRALSGYIGVFGATLTLHYQRLFTLCYISSVLLLFWMWALRLDGYQQLMTEDVDI